MQIVPIIAAYLSESATEVSANYIKVEIPNTNLLIYRTL